MKITIDREIFHQMMRIVSGDIFRPEAIPFPVRDRMKLLAERLAHATAAKVGGTVEVDVTWPPRRLVSRDGAYLR